MSGPDIVLWMVRAAGSYAVLGFLFAVAFGARGAAAVDPAAREAGWGFRVLIAPGVAALWPLLAWRWCRGTGAPPAERTAHKDFPGRIGS